MMDSTIKRKWVDALRSGEYKQGYGKLRSLPDDNNVCSFCCLGVLCEIKGLFHQEALSCSVYSYPNSDGTIVTLSKSLGENYEDFGLTLDQQSYLIHLNDNYDRSFADIADYIESEI